VRRTLEARDAAPGRVEKIPVPILALGALYVFYIVMFHILILFNGLFPLFGTFCFGMQGIILLDISIACLALLAWGTLRQRRWAWWASVIFLGLFTFSMVFSLCSTGYAALLRGLKFPAKEMEMLDGLPFQGWHFAILLGVPLLSTWVLAVVSRRHFQPLK